MQLDSYRVYTHAEQQPGKGIETIPYQPDPWDAYTEQDDVLVQHWAKILQTFPEYTFYICNQDNQILASGTSVPLWFDAPIESLPDGGWRWAIKTALNTAESGKTPDLVSALGINVTPSWRGQGLSKLTLRIMRETAQKQGFANLIAPVRPSQKHRYPLILMDDYITWVREDGLCFDAWMRTHQRMDATIIRVASESMVVTGTVAQWEEWTQMSFPGSGQHIVPGALVPVHIDREADTGTYIEPNVWMRHILDSPRRH